MNEKQNDIKPAGKEKKPIAVTVVAVVASVLLVLAAVLGFFGYKYRSHIHAAFIWLTASEEKIQNNIKDAKKKQEDALKEYGFVNASQELEEALESGLITEEEHTSILSGEFTLDEMLAMKNSQSGDDESESVQNPSADVNDENTGNEQTPSDEKPKTDAADKNETKPEAGNKPVNNETQNGVKNETPQKKPQTTTQTNTQTGNSSDAKVNEVDKRVAELVTKMYVLKAEYTGAVEGVVSSMKAQYVLLPVEQRTKSAKVSIAESYMGQINMMEAQCDAQVNAVVTELRKLLKDNGRDTALADAIVSSYATEKDNTKAYYLSTYGD